MPGICYIYSIDNLLILFCVMVIEGSNWGRDSPTVEGRISRDQEKTCHTITLSTRLNSS